jgi:hypothetical protein
VGFDPAETFRDCPWCGLRDAQMRTAASGIEAARLGAGPRFWTTLTCPRCGGLIAIEHTHPSQPPNVLSVSPPEERTAVAHLPEDVKAYYGDAKRVMDAGVPDAAAVQLRRTLEAAAAHHGIDSGPLVKRIQGLIDAGLITKGFEPVLQHIRQLGNVGAHAGDERVNEETAQRAFRFTTQVLINLFEIPAELAAISTVANASSEQETVEA